LAAASVAQQQGRLNGYTSATAPLLVRWLRVFVRRVWRPDLLALTAESSEFQRRRPAIRLLLTTSVELGLAGAAGADVARTPSDSATEGEAATVTPSDDDGAVSPPTDAGMVAFVRTYHEVCGASPPPTTAAAHREGSKQTNPCIHSDTHISIHVPWRASDGRCRASFSIGTGWRQRVGSRAWARLCRPSSPSRMLFVAAPTRRACPCNGACPRLSLSLCVLSSLSLSLSLPLSLPLSLARTHAHAHAVTFIGPVSQCGGP
jgi:hypothetical protein